jgi:tRNA-2-methylthio-N6-dimethylallyladenosine synthase
MHRGYTRARYLELVARLRAVRPEIGLSTDFIVGFPGETEDDFAQTLELAAQGDFDGAYVFKYSPRGGTPAVVMPGAVPPEVIEERHARLLAVVNECGRRRREALVGRQLQVLGEGPSRKNPARLEGRTRCNKLVVWEGSPRQVGQLLDLRITRASSSTLYGDPAIVNLD